ncbi:hypothetical protein MSG28_006568 [Choristoneura fumiferana]|uniref:Uncharacterized protein n=1 Tax=Choristoneura fumiferana TaxID=7141 RepID=A0ACC0JFD8_CHOFU|nr:hypothetical protein MSG28_006568 [Choristoneura fumiferana]
MDDINMPVRDAYGSQPPLELDMVLCGAAGPPGGARSPLPPRLLSCFHAFYLTPPTYQQLIKIFGTMLGQHLQDFDEETKGVGE